METPRRREIEDVASTLFREHGYAGTSVRDIARALDIQGASLYAHVTSKQDVLWSIVERTASRFEAAAEAATETGDARPSTRLSALVSAHIAVVTEDIGRASVFVHEWRALVGEHRTQMARRRDAYEQRFRTVIADGVESGQFTPTDPTIAAAFLLTALNGIATWYRPGGWITPDALAAAYRSLALRSVGATDGTTETQL
jgi:AcrR family transcriptional regulator